MARSTPTDPTTPDALPATLGELRASGWRPRTVKEELRANLVARLAAGKPSFPGIVGYDETVIPSIENAILAGQDIVFLGERGQAKTRLARLLVDLLDEWLPVVRGGELNDDPFAPISAAARAIVAEGADETPIDWIPRDRRYAEKLATPDITIADLIGEIDPIRVAEGRYLSDELTLHYGLIPRANRGIFALNELPDLAERIQVGLLNILEERDVQVRGFTIRLPLDLFVVASANPEDYTSRGRIITPLKDRLGSQVRTHYPRSLEHEVAIMRQEKQAFPARDGIPPVVVPAFMEELVAELTHLARRAPEISQRSGVSVRVSVANMEVLEAAAIKRAVRLGEPVAAPRVSDLGAVLATTTGKVEVETVGEDTPEERIVERLVTKAVFATFNRHASVDRLEPVLEAFEDGLVIETGDRVPAKAYAKAMSAVPGLRDSVERMGAFDAADGAEEPALVASAIELLLEGLHLHRRLNKDRGRPASRTGADDEPTRPNAMAFLTPDPRHLDRGDVRPLTRPTALPADARYRAWDGSQDIPDLTADELVDALSDDLLEHGDIEEALRRLLQRGLRTDDPGRSDLRGLRDLMDRLRDRRRDVLEQGQLADPLAEVREELDGIVAQERAGVQRRLDDTEPGADGTSGTEGAPDPELQRMLRTIAAKRLDSLDALPPDVGARVRALQDYDFLDADARQRFDALVDRLRASMLDRLSKGLSEAVKGMKPEDLAAQREMVRDLNDLLEQRVAGEEPSQDDVDRFLAQHGGFFPGAETLDDVIEQLAERMAAMQSLLRSLSPEQRAELQDTIDALLRDDRLRWDLAELAANLDQLLPGGLGERAPFRGDTPLGLESALEQLDRLAALDQLEAQLDGTAGPGDLADIDRGDVRDLLGPDALRDLDALEDVVERLERAGYLERDGERLELTPRATRRIGQKVLDELFARLQRDAFGSHRLAASGRGGEREEVAKPIEFGDPFHLDLRGTLWNAMRREENAPAVRAGAPLRLRPDDFDVYRTERTTSAATVLLVDMSRSMLLRGCFLAAKRVAIALDTLIRTQYPRDHLSIVGFAYYARELRPEALAELSWHGYEYGTNLQHGLLLARKILARQRAANKEIVVITDGEPTAHFENGQVEFSYPPTRRTIQETLREVVRCTKDGITINTFMLERTPALTDFIGLVTELNRGRAFYAEPEHLGEYVLVDFVNRRTKRSH